MIVFEDNELKCSTCYDRKAKTAAGPPYAVLAGGRSRVKTLNAIIA